MHPFHSGIRPRQWSKDWRAAQNMAAANTQASTHQAKANSQNFHRELEGCSRSHSRVRIGAPKGLITIIPWGSHCESVPIRSNLASSHARSGRKRKESTKRGQPTAIRTKIATLMAIARLSRGTQVARANPMLVMAAP